MSQLAARMAVASKINSEELVVLEEFSFPANKTKEAAGFLKKSGLKGTCLWAFDQKEKEAMRACRNLPKVKLTWLDSLNVLDILNSRNLLVSRQGAEFLNRFYAKKVRPKKTEKEGQQNEAK